LGIGKHWHARCSFGLCFDRFLQPCIVEAQSRRDHMDTLFRERGKCQQALFEAMLRDLRDAAIHRHFDFRIQFSIFLAHG
jgi:hypothetical protein